MKNNPEFDMTYFIERLKERRHQLGISGRDLSSRLKQHSDFIHHIEREGVKRLPVHYFVQIANQLKVPITYFFRQEEDSTEKKTYIDLWRCLDAETKRTVMELLKKLAMP